MFKLKPISNSIKNTSILYMPRMKKVCPIEMIIMMIILIIPTCLNDGNIQFQSSFSTFSF